MKQRYCNMCEEWKDLTEFKGRVRGQSKCDTCWDKWNAMRQRKHKNSMEHIYILIDPFTNELRYVGRAIDPKTRLSVHISHAKNLPFLNSQKSQWINSIVGCGEKPILKVIETMPYNTTGKERELFYIDIYKRNGADLLNAEAA